MDRVDAARRKVTLQVLLQSEDTIRVTPFKEGSVLESTVKTSRTCPFHSRMVADRAREILGILARANAGAKGLLPELTAASQAIYVDLLPAFLKEKLAEAAGGNLVLHLDRPLLGIPWELLHDGDDFLGRRFRIGRLVTADGAERAPLRRGMVAPLSVLVVADPTGDLPAARDEALALGELLEDTASVGDVTLLMGGVTTRALRDALARHDVLHFAGHAETADGAAPRLRLSDGDFTGGMLEQLRGRVDFPGLVFLNGCGSADDTVGLARGALSGGAVTGLASSFLMCGVRHVVGTLWDVRDAVARQFATGFYTALGRGETIGAAMAAGQSTLVEAHGLESLLWADHLLYGDPTWSIEPRSNLLSDDFDVLDGLEAKYRSDLDAPEPTRRLLAATMLLRLGDRAAVGALGRDLELIGTWTGADATRQQRRQAALVIRAMAAAAGLEPDGDADPDSEALPDMAAVRALHARLAARLVDDGGVG